MLDGPDVSVVLRGGVRTRAQAWDFVRWFAEAWTGRPLRPEDGCGEDELTAAEAGLEGVREDLPGSWVHAPD